MLKYLKKTTRLTSPQLKLCIWRRSFRGRKPLRPARSEPVKLLRHAAPVNRRSR